MFTITVNLPDGKEEHDLDYSADDIQTAFANAKEDWPNWTSMVVVVTRRENE